MLHAYVKSSLGRKRYFLHERGGTPLAPRQQDLSYLQQQFLVIAYDHYGHDKSDLPASARKHL